MPGGDLTNDFSRWEFECRCCGASRVKMRAVKALQRLRTFFDRRITVNSGYRCPFHNKEVGGSPTSRHVAGDAFDIVVEGVDPVTVAWVALAFGWTGIIAYTDPGRTHIDKRPGTPYRKGF